MFKKINWLASYPKSGNTWVRMFLDAYFLNEVDINEVITSVPDDIIHRHLPGDGTNPKTFPIDIQMLTRPMALLRLVSQYNTNKIDGLPLYVKTHNINMIVNGIEAIPLSLTNSCVYIVRDPRDVVISFAKHMGVDIDKAIHYLGDKHRVLIDGSGLKMHDYLSSWDCNVRSFLSCDTHNTLIIKYEDLKARPIENFKKILKHTGSDINDKKVNQAIEMSALNKLKKQEEEKGFRESSVNAKNQFFGSGLSGGWKDVLTPIQVRRIEKTCGYSMQKLGYIERAKRWA